MLAERDFPEEERYDGYIQLENGVGMMRLFREEFAEKMRMIKDDRDGQCRLSEGNRTIAVATGRLAYPLIRDAAKELCSACPGLAVHVFPIRNDFFGETITVAGLVTGQDLISQLRERQQAGESLGDVLLIPSNMLRSGEQVFLDDVTVQDVERALGMPVAVIDSGGGDFVEAALHPDYCMDRENDGDSFVYVQSGRR